MKIVRFAIIVLAAALVLVSCSSMSGALSAVSGGGPVAAASVATYDFQSGEVVASASSGQEMDADFYVAKVLQPASPATKNQAQVVFVHDGSKSWVNYVLNSRKATKADMAVGATVLYLAGWQGSDNVPADTYRTDRWGLANITSVDELYKNHVEVGGDSFNINYLRVPLDPIK